MYNSIGLMNALYIRTLNSRLTRMRDFHSRHNLLNAKCARWVRYFTSSDEINLEPNFLIDRGGPDLDMGT